MTNLLAQGNRLTTAVWMISMLDFCAGNREDSEISGTLMKYLLLSEASATPCGGR